MSLELLPRDPDCEFCEGEPCPYDPSDVQIGMHHCPLCGLMVMGLYEHLPCDCQIDWNAIPGPDVEETYEVDETFGF